YIPGNLKEIDLNEPKQVKYWVRELNITEDLLRMVIGEVGVMVDDVKEFAGIDS
ncbi:Protein of unknown function DUF3606 like protein, partial [Aduncisulcus paluster]